MESLGQYTLFTRNGTPVPCEGFWLSRETDWDFVAGWEIASGAEAPPSIRDSLEYALIGMKRWQWLSGRAEVALSFADAKRRAEADPEGEFAFALLVTLDTGPDSRIAGFCYARRVWTGTICLEFLGVAAPAEVAGSGSLLMCLLARIAIECGSAEIWGECTKASRGFYRRLHERISQERAQTSGRSSKSSKVEARERFSFNGRELALMRHRLINFRR